MSYNDITSITDPLEAIKALFAELTNVNPHCATNSFERLNCSLF